MTKLKVLGLCGSLRVESWNLKLLRNFLDAMNPEIFETQLYGSLELPLMNEDLEKLPLDQRILDLKKAVSESHVLIIATPEYNSSLSPVIKNALDWGSRGAKSVWEDKVAVIMAASPGALGGARNLIHLRAVLSQLKIWTIPEQVQVPKAHEAFENGKLKVPFVDKQIQGALKALESFTKKYYGSL